MTYHSRLIPEGVAEASQIVLRLPLDVLPKWLSYENTADVTGSKPIAVWLQFISGGDTGNPLVAFYDVHGRKREVLFFCSVPDTKRDIKTTRGLWKFLIKSNRIEYLCCPTVSKITNTPQKNNIVYCYSVFFKSSSYYWWVSYNYQYTQSYSVHKVFNREICFCPLVYLWHKSFLDKDVFL
jgi:hypothetical protein